MNLGICSVCMIQCYGKDFQEEFIVKKLLLTLALVSALTVTGCSNNSDKPADNNTKTEENAEKPA